MCQGYETSAAPRRATCVSGSLPSFLTVDYWNICPGYILLEIMARMILSGCFWQAME